MSSVSGSDEERMIKLRDRLVAAVRRIAFFVVPSAIAFVVFGDVIVRALFEGRKFHPIDTVFTWGILAASAVGLLASTIGRLYSSAYYAMHDTRSPFRIALAIVGVIGFSVRPVLIKLAYAYAVDPVTDGSHGLELMPERDEKGASIHRASCRSAWVAASTCTRTRRPMRRPMIRPP